MKTFTIGLQPQFMSVYLRCLRDLKSDNDSHLDFYKRKFDIATKRKQTISDDLKHSIIFHETEDEILRGRLSDLENQMKMFANGGVSMNELFQ